MIAARISGPGVVEVVTVETPAPGPGEALLEVELTGICATDLHIVDGHFPTAQYPLVLGHESVGRVVAVGEDVTGLPIGTRVAIDPGMPCGSCRPCRGGRPNLCEHREAIGITKAGAAAQFVVLPAVNCHELPDDLAPEIAVLAEPTACVVHALDLVAPIDGRRVLVYGAGTVGMLASQIIRHLAAETVTVVDTSTSRLDRIRTTGVDEAVENASLATTGPEWDLVVDATGAPRAIEDGLSRLARGGTFLQIGVAPPEASIPLSPYEIFARELQIRGSLTTRHSFPRAIALLASGMLDVTGMVGARPLSEYAEAVEAARRGEHLKVAVDPRR